MPAILAGEWPVYAFSSSVRAHEAGKLLKPISDDLMVGYPITKLVNVPKNESPVVLEPFGSA